MPRTNLMDRRQYDAGDLDRPVTCPAGERIGERLEGPGCRCRIEQSNITAAFDGSSLAAYCQGRHQLCPTWRLAREAEWEHERLRIEAEGVQRSFTLDDLQEVEERRAAGDEQGVQAIRRRIFDARREQGLRDLE